MKILNKMVLSLIGVCCSTVFLTCNLLTTPSKPIEPRLLGKWVNLDTLWEDDTKKNSLIYYLVFREDRTYSRAIWKQVGDSFSDLGGSYGNWFKYTDTEIVVFYNYSGYPGHPSGTTSQSFFFRFNSWDTVQLVSFFSGEFNPWPGWKKFVKVDSLYINRRWW
jgi:hypothetical protein